MNIPPDLDRLASELNQLGITDRAGPIDGDRLERWLSALVEARGSDLLLVAGEPPSIRVDGKIARLPLPILAGGEIEELLLAVLPPHGQSAYREKHSADAALRFPGKGRFRVNLHRERGRAAAAIRALPTVVPSLASLRLPPGAEALTRIPYGLVLLGGATGSGKTTTLAALIQEINAREARHVVMIEDPVEYDHANKQSVIEQVEIGVDATDFPTALRSALRQAPDILVVGEMRDPETMRIALAAAETGHLVFSTIHTTDVASTISRIADSFPQERQPTIRQELAMAVAAVFTQVLLPKRGGGRVPAAELLMISYGARQHIRRNALQHLHQEITITRKSGSFSLEDSLARLVKDGLVERQDAALRANHPEEFDKALAALSQ